jgi:hypothetical protein
MSGIDEGRQDKPREACLLLYSEKLFRNMVTEGCESHPMERGRQFARIFRIRTYDFHQPSL